MYDDATKTLGRLLDFFGHNTPWPRRLWGIGVVLGLREIIEYNKVAREGNLSNDGLKYAIASMMKEIVFDRVILSFVNEVNKILENVPANEKTSIYLSEHDEAKLEQLTQRLDERYFDWWIESAEKGMLPPVERTARSIAAYLLDNGFSPDLLYRWLDGYMRNNEEPNLTELFIQAKDMVSKSLSRPYEVVVPCVAPIQINKLPSAVSWMNPSETAAFISDLSLQGPKPRQNGSLVLRVVARDNWAAIEAANDLVVRVVARMQVGFPKRVSLAPVGKAYIKGTSKEFELRSRRRQLDIHALDRQNAVFNVDSADFQQLDDALELASYMKTGSIGAAITGGWAAIEGLLVYPKEPNRVAADRLAAIVSCSVGRAELTSIAFAHSNFGNDRLADELRNLDTEAPNYERVRLVEGHIRKSGTMTLSDPSNQAALDRVVKMINSPATEISHIRQYVQDTFRRLYNQRNLVMHGGSFRSVALPATLRTAPPLVGAGLDRIVHAQLRHDQTLSPLSLAARADNELALLGESGSSWIVDLLGR
ncbi:hypothetical protein [Acidithrix ferrooxidans]|uniref:Uncharacterized protein n=1 Tax=Acidithrix ferrooxidans TaxID=1280514 RepID=A0A0D8HM60_9ACTN|nr:hypothetical protein [Acidithrix ferrooxidans]KJF19100.1 hypothetical protein AXFE_01370 [Acidithrix ferrooxidans]